MKSIEKRELPHILTKNIFISNTECPYIHLSIDKENISSIKMAKNCGFKENYLLEQELRETNDNHTLIFSIKNKFYEAKEEVKKI